MTDLYEPLCSYDNLLNAFENARKGKTCKLYVIKFEQDLKGNLFRLRNELLMQTYQPRPLETFTLRDPKTRTISKSDFRDRVVHHALCNVIEPLFDKTFIYDSYANRIGKGALKAVERFDSFKYKVSKNFTRRCYVLKADVRHYFETIDHEILISMIRKRVQDQRVLWLVETILANHQTTSPHKGMPLGNLTSQFFANVYLNDLDQFVKHTLRVRYYIRYVDDFVILDTNKERLLWYQNAINTFLKETLRLTLHPEKSRICTLEQGDLKYAVPALLQSSA